ncbi:glycosyl hydrolase family 28 protein [Persicobacter diffluens]|uniref:Glycosyl hydrolases family 28 n=1 Tax=Persicobacter diffluens TaxID=981 RepID=A0AAN4W3Q4_9BACT|nr:hypothetical protein PEDI_48760 [Persicobacter diffluens]
MSRKFLFIIFILGYNLFSCAPAEEDIVIYHYPKEVEPSGQFKAWLAGAEATVYPTEVAGLLTFGAHKAVEVVVEPQFAFKKVDIRPQNLGIKAKIEGGKVIFSMPVASKVVLEFDQRVYQLLYVFSQTPVEDRPADIIFKSGEYYQNGFAQVKSGQKVWVQAGAVVEGYFLMEDVEEVEIFGHGIIDNSRLGHGAEQGYHGINWIKARDSKLENVHLIGNPRWSTSFFGCDDMEINDVRIIDWRPSDDGIDLVGCRNVEVKNAFIRTKDDCIAIKAMPFDVYWPTAPEEVHHQVKVDVGCRNVENIRVSNCVLWNAEWGNAIEIGFETQADSIGNILFTNIDVLHVEANGGVFTIHNGDRALVHNVHYKDIRIEEANGFLCHFQILDSHYSKDDTRGNGQNIMLENIAMQGPVQLNSLITGLSDQYAYRGISFHNISLNDKVLNNITDAGLYSEYSYDITFE